MNSRSFLASALATLSLAIAQPANALVISATFTGFDAAGLAVINSAIAFYEATFTDPITVTIAFHNMSSGLGSSLTNQDYVPYDTFRSALVADATSADDLTALASLPVTSTNPVNGATNLLATDAQLRAAGLTSFLPTPIVYAGFCNTGATPTDGCIGLNESITTTGSASLGYSLLAVAQHEIDEVLGVGGAGSSLWYGGVGPNPGVEDLFRYSASGVRSYARNGQTTKLCTGAPGAYFSIDGGATDLANFNNCNNGADYADWAAGGSVPQVQDAYGTPGGNAFLTRSSVEVVALDISGYTLAPVIVAAPEPGSLALLGVGLAAGWRFKRRRTAA